MTPGIGHNQPPLEEQLGTDTSDLSQRVTDLLGGFSRAVFATEDDIKKALLLGGMMAKHVKAIDEARRARKEPFLAACRTIDAHYNALEAKLVTADAKGRQIGGPLFDLTAKIDAFRREDEAKKLAERRRLEQEAEAKRQEAERLAAPPPPQPDQIAFGVPKPPAPGIDTEIAQQQARGAADELQRQADAVAVRPIDTGVGVKASGRKVLVITITDIRKAAGHCLKVALPDMKVTIQGVYERLARAKIRDLPGATITEDSRTVIRGG